MTAVDPGRLALAAAEAGHALDHGWPHTPTADSSEAQPDRVYVRSYTEHVHIVVTEKDAREHMDRDEKELTDAHWEAAARYLTPEGLESTDMDRER